MRLNEIKDCEGANHVAKRVGRGIGSGVGKTCGRGVKGQKSRSGVAIKGFEGGQMPLYQRLPKRGFKKPFRKKLNAVNVGRIQQAIDAGKLDEKETVNAEKLKNAGVIRRVQDGVRLLSEGDITAKVKFELVGASKKAKEKVEKAGGSIVIIENKPSEPVPA